MNKIAISLDLATRDINGSDVFNWCKDQFGREHINWSCFAFGQYPVYVFHNEKDAVLFALKWK